MKRIDVLALSIMYLALTVTILTSHTVYGMENAKFTGVEYPKKIYSGESAQLKFTVVNPSTMGREGKAPRFFLRVYLDGNLIKDEMPESWECFPDQSIERIITTTPLQGERNHQILGRLFWLNQSIAVVQDEVSFEIKGIKLEIKEFRQSIDKVTLGQDEAINFQIQFSNGGNDIMYEVTMNIEASQDVLISPTQVAIGDLSSAESTSIDLKLEPKQSFSGEKIELAYIISYKDFRGVVHKEEFKSEISVSKALTNLKINLIEDEIPYNTNLTISAYLTTLEGKPLSEHPVEFYVDNISTGIYKTNKNGVASANLNTPLDVGVHELKTLYHGSSIYAQSSSIKTINILPSTTKLDLFIPSDLRVSDETRAYVKLLDSEGLPIKNVEILLYCNDRVISRSVTNLTGDAEMPFTVTSKGDLVFKAVYVGDLNHHGAEKTTQLRASALKSTLTIQAPSQIWKGETVNLRIKLTDELGKPIPDAPIELVILSRGNPVTEFNVKTDESGTAEGSFNSDNGVDFKIVAHFNGDEKYSSFEASSTITVMDTSTLFLLLIPIMGALTAIIVTIFWKRGSFSNLRGVLKEGGRRSVADTQQCSSCGSSIPLDATYCDICGNPQNIPPTIEETPMTPPGEAPPAPETVSDDVSRELDGKVLSYIADHGGEISMKRAVVELGVSREELLMSIDRLRKAGRLEQV